MITMMSKPTPAHIARGLGKCLLAWTVAIPWMWIADREASAQTVVAYTGGTLETVGEAGRIEDGTLVVRGGKITAVGAAVDVTVPDDAVIVSLRGRTVIPAIVDPYQVVGERREQPDFSRFRGRLPRNVRFERPPVTEGPFARVADYFYPYETDFEPSVRSGVVTANLVFEGHGQSALARLGGPDPESMIFDPNGLMFAAVTNETKALETLRNGLDPDRARSGDGGGRSARGRFGGGADGPGGGRRGGLGGGGGSRGGGRGGSDELSAETRALLTRLWGEIRDGKRPLMLNANNAAAILHALSVVEPYESVRLAIVSTGSNLYELLDELRGRKVSLILRPGLDEIPYTTDIMNVPRMAHERGIPFAFSLSLNATQLTGSQDDPLFPVAYLVKTGLDRGVALRALTLEPAVLLGLGDSRGSLEAGKLANFLIFDGDPLATGSRLRQVVVEGDPLHEN